MSLEDRLDLTSRPALPPPMQSWWGMACRALPQSWRFGARYREFKELAEAGEGWPPEQIQEYQIKQLRIVLHHAANSCPFYQKSFARAAFRPEHVRTLDDLKDCPWLEKNQLQTHLSELLSSEVPASKRIYRPGRNSAYASTGFYLQKGVSRPKEQGFLETMWRRAGYGKGARLAVIHGDAGPAKSHQPIATYDAARKWLNVCHVTPQGLPECLEALERFKPDLLHADPSVALQLVEHFEASGLNWPLPLRGLLCGSGGLTLPQKRILERIFHCRVYRWYGPHEQVLLAGEGASSELLYFYPQYGLVEFGPANAQGACELIGTSFHNFVMPLIRYRTGDYAQLADPRTDGDLEFPWPAIKSVASSHQAVPV